MFNKVGFKKALIITISFLIAFFGQILIWSKTCHIDYLMWVNQTKLIIRNDPDQYDFKAAYAHPGSTITNPAIALLSVFPVSYERGLRLSVSVLSASALALTAYLAYLLRPAQPWWFSIVVLFSFHYLLNAAPPPTVLISLAILLLSLISLALYENLIQNRFFKKFAFPFTAGFIMATRWDSSLVVIPALMLFLKKKFSFKILLSYFIGTVIVFCLLDHYIWTHPVKHLLDLFHKLFMHYRNFPSVKITILTQLELLVTPIVFLIIAGSFRIWKKRLISPLPSRFTATLLAIGLIKYLIIMSARYQAVRYIIPEIFLIEMLLPLFLFSLIDCIPRTAKYTEALNKPMNFKPDGSRPDIDGFQKPDNKNNFYLIIKILIIIIILIRQFYLFFQTRC